MKYPRKFFMEKSGFAIMQMETNLQSFKKALPQMWDRMEDKFLIGVKEHGPGFFDLPRDTIKGMEIEEWQDIYHYTLQPHYKTWLEMKKSNPFKS